MDNSEAYSLVIEYYNLNHLIIHGPNPAGNRFGTQEYLSRLFPSIHGLITIEKRRIRICQPRSKTRAHSVAAVDRPSKMLLNHRQTQSDTPHGTW